MEPEPDRTKASSADSSEASPVSAFLSRFAATKLAAESVLSACRSSPDDSPATLAVAVSAIDDLDCLVTEASHSLPPYELCSALAVVSDLHAAHRLAASEIRPKKSFSFRNKGRATKNPPQDPPNLPSPPPEEPKPSLDAILPGLGFRGRKGATLVKDLRISDDKDGDFTLVDLVSCEVYLKGICRALYVHKLRGCRVFVGAVLGSVLIEDVERCTFVMAAHQIRIHEARATDFYLRVRSNITYTDARGGEKCCFAVCISPLQLSVEGLVTSHGMDIMGPVGKSDNVTNHRSCINSTNKKVGKCFSWVGDDRTDEDAFKVLRDNKRGFGILVSSAPKESHAFYSLMDPTEVMNFLKRLVIWKEEEASHNK